MASTNMNSSPLSDALHNPTPTKIKRGRQYAAVRDAKRAAGIAPKREYTMEALDTAALSRKYGMDRAHHPRRKTGTFHVPLDVSPRTYQGIRDGAINTFIEYMDKEGWDFVSDLRIQVYPGVYPARDLATGLDLLDRREFLVQAHFRFRNPQPVRIELPPELLEAQTFK